MTPSDLPWAMPVAASLTKAIEAHRRASPRGADPLKFTMPPDVLAALDLEVRPFLRPNNAPHDGKLRWQGVELEESRAYLEPRMLTERGIYVRLDGSP